MMKSCLAIRMTISVAGFSEIATNAVTEMDGWQIVTIPGLCISKLISYSEKQGRRKKDFDDFIFLLENYSGIIGDSIFEDELFIEMISTHIDTEIAAANFLGREIKTIINHNIKIKTQLIDTLLKELGGYTTEEVLSNYKNGRDFDKDIAGLRLIIEVISELKKD
jgi:predicted nucleotidyltransferase